MSEDIKKICLFCGRANFRDAMFDWGMEDSMEYIQCLEDGHITYPGCTCEKWVK